MLPDTFGSWFYAQKEKHTFWRYTFSSLFAHTITRTILAPVERLKLIFQTQHLTNRPIFSSYAQCTQTILRDQGGILSFWRGNLTNIYRVIPTNWAKFASFIYFKAEFFPKGMSAYRSSDLLMRHFLCGMSCSFFIHLLGFPFDAARIRQSLDLSTSQQQRLYTSTCATFGKLCRNEGIVSLYKGFWISYACTAPYLAAAFAFYEHIRGLFHPSIPEEQQPSMNIVFKILGAGGLAAVSASILTYPLETIKHRMMVNGGMGFNTAYSSIFNCIFLTAKTEGILGFYRGFLAHSVKVVPALGFQFSIYDNTRMLIAE